MVEVVSLVCTLSAAVGVVVLGGPSVEREEFDSQCRNRTAADSSLYIHNNIHRFSVACIILIKI